MGGDGGVVATNRKYMRGAGSADHTGDYERNDPNSKEHNALEAMTTCALTKTPLFSSNSNRSSGPIVACSFGRLYHKEAAVEALLTKKQSIVESSSKNTPPASSSSLGDHIRKLSDLYEVRFHRDEESTKKRGAVTITCPITGKTLQGIIPAILLVPGKPDTPNVLSTSALQQLAKDELELEYGPILKEVRLAPPLELLKKLKEEEIEMRSQTKQKKTKKKRKHDGKDGKKKTRPKSITAKPKATINGAAKSRPETSSMPSSRVYSSIFTTSDRTKTDKDRKDSLFAR